MADIRSRSMDEEIGLLVVANTVLARSPEPNSVILLKMITAFTMGIEVEFAFISRSRGDEGEFERWDNMDLSDDGMKIGFSFSGEMPRLYAPRIGNEDDPIKGQPIWFPGNLWGSRGGGSSQTVGHRKARIPIYYVGEPAELSIGWSWKSQHIEPGKQTFPLPPTGEVLQFVSSVWE